MQEKGMKICETVATKTCKIGHHMIFHEYTQCKTKRNIEAHCKTKQN